MRGFGISVRFQVDPAMHPGPSVRQILSRSGSRGTIVESEGFQRGSGRVVRSRADPDIDVAGRSWQTVPREGICADQQELSLLGGQLGQHLAEVLVQQRASPSWPRCRAPVATSCRCTLLLTCPDRHGRVEDPQDEKPEPDNGSYPCSYSTTGILDRPCEWNRDRVARDPQPVPRRPRCTRDAPFSPCWPPAC